MKKALFLLALPFLACQPQTESRDHMEKISDRMSDSINNLIDSGFAEPAKFLVGTGSPIASVASSLTPSGLPK